MINSIWLRIFPSSIYHKPSTKLNVTANRRLNLSFIVSSIISAQALKIESMKSKLLFSALFVVFLGISNISMAQDGHFQKNHPRRAELNHRLNNQDRRIHNKYKHGDISRRQAYHLIRRDHQIRKEERRMAYRNGGHLSRHQQHRLNRQENHMSRRIRRV